MSDRDILLGHDAATRAPIRLDLDVLLRTRLLVQANSGGGKSWLLRRLAEQLFGRLPAVLIDPEGEFATLRERYGYVLVGQGGDTPADVRSAALVAQRLLELRASAVCDLYEMPPGDRHEWVRRFLTALIDAPKKLWQPLAVIVDEAHLFVPEKGGGESVAAEAMIGLATRGRKRGFCAIWATQRLAKVRKDAAAELQNVLIGPTFMDADRERAADALGIARADKPAFFDQIKLLAEGHFYGLGRAIALERVLVKIGPVTTTHPEPGSTKHAAAPPPPPEKVRAILPKLADLPAEAETQARTLAEAMAEIRRLKGDVVAAKRANPAPAIREGKIQRVEIPVLAAKQVMRLESAIRTADKAIERLGTLKDGAQAAINGIVAATKPIADELRALRVGARVAADVAAARVAVHGAPTALPETVRVLGSMARAVGHQRGGGSTLPAGERRVLTAIAQYDDGAGREQLTVLTGYKRESRRTYLQRLSAAGFIERVGDRYVATAAGRAALGDAFDPLPTGDALRAYWLVRLSGGERRILEAVCAAYPNGLDLETLSAQTGYARESRRTYLQRLGARRLVERQGLMVRASAALFG